MAKNTPRSKSGADPTDMALETITPEVAKTYLAMNIANRNLNRATVARYRRDMLNGRWRVTGDPIRFDTNGKLFDGQHRLAACIEAQKPFTTLVVRQLEPETVNVIDSGRGRRAHDVLALHHYTNSYLLASAARWLIVMRQGIQVGQDVFSGLKPSHEEILDVVRRHPELGKSCNFGKHPKGCFPSLLAATHYVGKHLLEKPDLADAFVRVFTQGVPHYGQQDPALKLREANLQAQQRHYTKTAKQSYIDMVYVWNAFAEGRAIPSWKPPQTTSIRGLKPEQI